MEPEAKAGFVGLICECELARAVEGEDLADKVI